VPKSLITRARREPAASPAVVADESVAKFDTHPALLLFHAQAPMRSANSCPVCAAETATREFSVGQLTASVPRHLAQPQIGSPLNPFHPQGRTHGAPAASTHHPHRLAHNRPDIGKRFNVGDFEFDSKFYFGPNNEINIIEGVPILYVLTPCLHRQDYRVIKQKIAENAGEYHQYLLRGHAGAPVRAM
jgi:hypothetical protein